MASNLKKYIRTIPDFPHAGIQFRDITTLFNNSKGLRETVDQMADAYHDQKEREVARQNHLTRL